MAECNYYDKENQANQYQDWVFIMSIFLSIHKNQKAILIFNNLQQSMHQSSTKVAKDALDNFLNASKYLRLQKFDVILNIKRAVLMQIQIETDNALKGRYLAFKEVLQIQIKHKLKSLDRPYTEIAKEALQHFLRAANYVSLQKIDDLRKIQTAIIMQIQVETDEALKRKYEVFKSILQRQIIYKQTDQIQFRQKKVGFGQQLSHFFNQAFSLFSRKQAQKSGKNGNLNIEEAASCSSQMSLSYSKNEDTAADYQGKKEKDSRPKTM